MGVDKVLAMDYRGAAQYRAMEIHMPEPKTSLASALLAAQSALPSVGKDSKNSFHHYAYTSSEAMIGACRAALHSAGLVLRRSGWTFEGTADGGIVKSQFILSCPASGESVTDEVGWVAIPEKGRPVDKALASALTASLNYFLRDLLMVPREEESEMDKRDDTKFEPRKTAPAPAARQTQQEAPRSIPAPKAAPVSPKASEPVTAAPSAFGEVMASRPAKDCAWRGGMVVKKVGQGKATKNGGQRWPILFESDAGEEWASCFDENVMLAAQDCMGGQPVDAFVQSGQYGLTLYGIRVAVNSEQPAAATVPAEDEIPF
jgi:hypothetical protein